MKLYKILFPALLLISGSASALTILGSNHDLSSTNTDPAAGLTLEGICIYCHSPHNALTGMAAPLWNRTTYTATYTMYSSDTLDMTIQSAPDAYSAACLSCHDGVQALDSLINTPYMYATAQTGNFISWGEVGTDLSNDHPISVVYSVGSGANQDPDFVAQATVEAAGLPFFTGTGSNQVECATCHMVHDDANGYFLRLANDASALCLTCHVK